MMQLSAFLATSLAMEVLEFMGEIDYSSICGNDGLLMGPFATSY